MSVSTPALPRGTGELLGGPLCGSFAEFDMVVNPDPEKCVLPGIKLAEHGFPQQISVQFAGEEHMYRFREVVTLNRPPIYEHQTLWK